MSGPSWMDGSLWDGFPRGVEFGFSEMINIGMMSRGYNKKTDGKTLWHLSRRVYAQSRFTVSPLCEKFSNGSEQTLLIGFDTGKVYACHLSIYSEIDEILSGKMSKRDQRNENGINCDSFFLGESVLISVVFVNNQTPLF